MNHRRISRATLAALVLIGVVAVTGITRANSDEDSHGFEIKTLSNRADLISGGDALVEVSVPQHVDLDKVVVSLNGRNITGSFTRNTDARTLRGLVTGLNDGENLITAGIKVHHKVFRLEWDDVVTVEKLKVTNHPIGGPVLSGNQIQPWICATPTAMPGNATTPHTNPSGLTTFATDAQCNIATEFRFWYKPTSAPANCAGIVGANACFKLYNPASPPADVSMTTTDRGVTVPFIVRRERGTIDRGIYDVAVLWDPSKTAAEQHAWNGKLQYAFGVADGSPRRQFAPNSAWFSTAVSFTNDMALGLGFMTAASSLTDQQLNSNLIVAAETLMMIKEHIIEQYGPIRYTMGIGCSGGSIEQNTIASEYPGLKLLDGLQISCTYPDSITTSLEVGDCVLLVNYFVSPEFLALIDSETAGMTAAQKTAFINAKKAAIAGHKSQRGCISWNAAFGTTGRAGNLANLPSVGAAIFATTPRAEFPNNCLLPASFVYDPVTNPTGIRCGTFDHAISIWGNAGDPQFPTRANETDDNVGAQYGLGALLSGRITAEDFVTLNEKIGGFNVDGLPQARRSTADEFALRTAYRSGTVGDGRSWAQVPIIDLRGNDNDGIHHTWRSFALRARLDEANGNHDNHVMWRFGPGLLPGPGATKLFVDSFVTMDKWLSNIESDTSHTPLKQKVRNDKPAEAFDFCYLSTDTTFSTKVTDFAVCNADPVLAIFSSPRQVAGGPLVENILKCQLKPLDPADYPAGTFTDAQLARLQAVFPDGVCDWTKPGVEQRPAVANLTFEDGPGGKRLHHASDSH